MKILILYQNRIPDGPEDIRCFSDVWAYYLVHELRRHVRVAVTKIPYAEDSPQLIHWAKNLDINDYDAIIATGLRYFSKVSPEVGAILKHRLNKRGFLCQIHDGSRLDNDPVDITFTLKDESKLYQYGSEANRFVRHHSYNEYIGWAADSNLNSPKQNPDVLRILVDHTNYGSNPIDRTQDVLKQIKQFADSNIWKNKFKGIEVRRFDSGGPITVDLNDSNSITNIKTYDRSTIPFSTICNEHSAAHIFCVTHPESVGQVVLETAMAGAYVLVPKTFVPKDRLDTVLYMEWEDSIDWTNVLANINPELSRSVAIKNSWETVAKRIRDIINIRKNIRLL